MALTIEDLKKHLGPGLGLRKSKYIIEVPIPGQQGKTVNILCRSTALPERNIGTIPIFDKGRKYNIRAETDFPGTYNISILDDSEMSLRWMFDGWLNLVDDTLPTGKYVHQSNASYEVRPNFSLGSFGDGGQTKYQTDINVWQLGNKGEKIYGYKLQNAFPSSLGIVELDDSDETTLSEFSVTFTYSEAIPIKPEQVSISSSSNSFNADDVTSADLEDFANGTNNFTNMTTDITDDIGDVTSGLGGITNGLDGAISGLGGVGGLGDMAGGLSGNITGLGDMAGEIAGNITGGLGDITGSLGGNIAGGLGGITDLQNSLGNLGDIGGVVSGLTGDIGNLGGLTGALSGVTDLTNFSDIANVAGLDFSTLTEVTDISGLVPNLDGFGSASGFVNNLTESALGGLQGEISNITNMTNPLSNVLNDAQVQLSGFGETVQNPLSGFTNVTQQFNDSAVSVSLTASVDLPF